MPDMTKYEELYSQIPGMILQLPAECLAFMEYLDTTVKPRSFLEIGICQGGTFFLWCSLAKPSGIKLGIDLPNGPWGVSHERTEKEIATNRQRFETFAPNTHVLFADSKAPSSIDWVRNKLDGEKLDFIFIDGDHSYRNAKIDYLNYSPLVRKGGIVAVHDIKDSAEHAKAACDVYKLWHELEGEKKEFVDHSSGYGGIGALIV